MTVAELKDLFEKNKNERGIAHWNRLSDGKMSSYGMGLGQIKKLAKGIKKDHDLALQLWKENNYEMKVLSGLLDEPKKVTPEQVQEQMSNTHFWMLSHSYVSHMMHKVKFAAEWAEDHRQDKNENLRRVSFLLIYFLAKDKGIDDSYFDPFLEQIDNTIRTEENYVKDAMNACLLTLGQRNMAMRESVLQVVSNYGTLIIDYGDTSCEPVDIAKHLNSDRILSKLSN